MTMSPFRVNDVIDNTPGNACLPGPLRILGFKDSQLCVIALPRPHPNRPSRTNDYVTGPRWVNLGECSAWFNHNKVSILNFKMAPNKQLPDADLIANAGSPRELKRVRAEIARRDSRFNTLMPLLLSDRNNGLKSALELIDSKCLVRKIRQLARKSRRSVTTIYRWLHLYWAGGSVKNALFTSYDRCGCPGVTKAQANSLGRVSRLYKAGKTAHRCYVLGNGQRTDCDESTGTQDGAGIDRQRLAWGWRLIKHGVTREDAYLETCKAFWADHLSDERNGIRPELWESHRRPTFNQFVYWGRKLNGAHLIERVFLGVRKWSQKTEARGGSVQDQVFTVGQLAGFDGTKTDLYLASRHNRLKKLPPMLRLIIKDVRTDVICGWYLGWEPASPQTALQAIFHAASSKIEECRRFGIETTDDEIPMVLHRTYQADHGELKANAVTECESQIGFGVVYVPTGRGDFKGGIETQHRKDHKELDHKLPGNTGGRRRERGEDHPALFALFNANEFRTEFIYQVIAHNNELAPHLAPTEMLVNNPEIEPTRINIFNWMRRRQSAEIIVDPEAMRAYALPDVEAVVRKNGVYPLLNVLGSKVVLPRFRFSSPELIATGVLSEVKRTGKSHRVRLKMSLANNPYVAWLPSKFGLIPLLCASRPEQIQDKLTIADWISLYEDRMLATDLSKPRRDQVRLNKNERRKAVELRAAQEAAAEVAKLGKRPSKASIVAELNKNLAEEKLLERSAAAVGLTVRSGEPKAVLAADSFEHSALFALAPPQPIALDQPAQSAHPAADPSATTMSALNDEEF